MKLNKYNNILLLYLLDTTLRDSEEHSKVALAIVTVLLWENYSLKEKQK